MFLKFICIIILFLILLSFFTYPLVFNLNSSIPGFSSSDETYAALWYFWWMKFSDSNDLNITNLSVISYPFGQIVQPGYTYWNFINKKLALISNPCITYNIQVLLSFILTGIIFYFLLFYITNNSLVSLFSATIFTFSPYHFVRSWQHLGLSHIQWIPLCLFSIFLLRNKQTLLYALLLALSFSLTMSFDLYYAYFMFLIVILFLLFDFFYKRDLRGSLCVCRLILISAFITIIIEVVDLYHIFKFMSSLNKSHLAQGVYGYIRPFKDLVDQSAKPLSYILPAASHPIFGKFTEQFIGTEFYGDSFTEHTLYLGWIPLILGLSVFRKLFKNKEPQLADKEKYFVGLFIFLAIVAWFFSQPPWWDIFGLKIFMPSSLMYKIAPMFRAYCRFGIVVMLAVAVLAGFGLKFLLERFKSQRTKLAITALFSVLVLFEFWNWPPYKVIDLSNVPAVYYWLKEQPKDIVIAEYPLDYDSPNELYKFFQTVHEKKIVNGTIPGTYANKVAQEIRRLSAPKTASILKWMGVKYVVVHKDDYLKTDLIEDREDMEMIPQCPGLRFVKIFPPEECPQRDIMCVRKTGQIDVYEVAANPIEPKVKE